MVELGWSSASPAAICVGSYYRFSAADCFRVHFTTTGSPCPIRDWRRGDAAHPRSLCLVNLLDQHWTA